MPGKGRRGDYGDDDDRYAWVTEAEITATEALGYMCLGEPDRAEELYLTALTGSLTRRNRLLYIAQLAVAMLNQGRLDDAIQVGLAVLGVLDFTAAKKGGVGSACVLAELRPIREAIRKETCNGNLRHPVKSAE